MNELLEMTLVELTGYLRDRKASPVELMEAVLARIEETNPDLNTVVARRGKDELLSEAKASEECIMSGKARPLEGIPLGVKDLENVKGMITSMGSIPYRDNMAEQDSIQVTRLKAAGAIVVGKTNTPEFGYTAITKNHVFGVTRSPWDLERTPGGSSGGSAAAMAACVLPLVTCSDGGGSIRIPASFTGAFGLKTSYGRIPMGPRKQWYYRDTSVYGPITKTVDDAALFLDQVAGPSPYDPKSLPHPGVSYVEKLKRPSPSGLKIGYSPDLGYAVVQSDLADLVEEGVKVFEKLGHSVAEVEGGPPSGGRDWVMLSGFENASTLHPFLPEREKEFGRAFIANVKTGWSMTPEIWGEAAHNRSLLNDWCADIFDRFDLLVTPTVPFDPPPAKGPFPEETEGRKQVPAAVAAFTIPFNFSLHPAATVRAGLSKAGYPVGLQIVGPRHRDDLVLQAASAFESERPWHPDWPTSW